MNEGFLKYLKRDARDADKKVMMDYRDGAITLGACRKRVFMNNDIPLEVQDKTSVEEFEEWLKELGWKRVSILYND